MLLFNKSSLTMQEDNKHNLVCMFIAYFAKLSLSHTGLGCKNIELNQVESLVFGSSNEPHSKSGGTPGRPCHCSRSHTLSRTRTRKRNLVCCQPPVHLSQVAFTFSNLPAHTADSQLLFC